LEIVGECVALKSALAVAVKGIDVAIGDLDVDDRGIFQLCQDSFGQFYCRRLIVSRR